MYILLVVSSVFGFGGFQVSEFSSLESCNVALEISRGFFRTVNIDSKCISVKEYLKKQKLEQELKKLTD